jgi:hypothetical protein
MDLDSAVQQYLIDLKEKAPRERVEFELAVLARLQEYLEGDPSLNGAESVGASDLRAFISDWLHSGEEPTPEAADGLVAVVVGFVGWLDRHSSSSPDSPRRGSQAPGSPGHSTQRAPIAPQMASLRESLPRTARVAQILSRHTHREDLSQVIPVEEADGGSPLGTISGGMSRVIRPSEIDYGRAEADTFVVVEVCDRSISLLSPAREQLGEGAAAPVAVPARAARLLRVGDILHVEIAPRGTGWEILHVEAVIPGGLDDRP